MLAKIVTYAPELMTGVAKLLQKEFGTQLPSRGGPPINHTLLAGAEFNEKFQKVFKSAIEQAEEKRTAVKAPSDFWDTKKGQELIKIKGATPDSAKEEKPTSPAGKKLTKAEIAAQKKAEKAAEKAAKGNKPSKQPSWHTDDKKVDIKDIVKNTDNDQDTSSSTSTVDVSTIEFEDQKEEESDSDDEATSGGLGGGLFKFIKGLTQKELSEENLKPVLEDIRSHLVAKNVAAEIADSLCDSVAESLKGQTHGTFKSISATVKNAMAEALTRLLTPKRHIDISREIQAAKDAGRPYSIVFVGVNGVGKSTTLAKVCAWLLKQQHRAMIAACDTFRSGAVEQLKVHGKALGGVPIFESGYGKDPANIAQQAIAKATTEAIDVVLIDTAGRMQDNEPLMAALAKLVKVNKPDLILFVGEALVGNDSVDQLTKFNRALEEYGDLSAPRTIDGIVLTKFDTVDDKVGAAISMVYTTGQPIIFVGVGQTYSDLRTLNVKKIVDILARGKTSS